MEEKTLESIADIMSKLSGEEVEVDNIIHIPENKAHINMSPDERCNVYVARTKHFTCLAHFHVDGRVHIYVH